MRSCGKHSKLHIPNTPTLCGPLSNSTGQIEQVKVEKSITNASISQVTTINSALLLFIHHWYIVIWWNNWKNYPYYSLWLSTRTQILVWKTRMGGRKLVGGVTYCTHFPSPATICLSEVHQPAYLPGPAETHLTATWGEKPSPLAKFLHVQPSPPTSQ